MQVDIIYLDCFRSPGYIVFIVVSGIILTHTPRSPCIVKIQDGTLQMGVNRLTKHVPYAKYARE